MTERIPLARPQVGPREEELVLEVLRSGRLSLGPMLERFERAFANWLGVDDAVAVSSGTAGLHLGVRGLGWGRGDEVLTTPLSFIASANCLLYEGATPIFCDVERETANIDPAAAAAAVDKRTAGILPVHLFGFPAAMPGLAELASKHGLSVLEDACQALGAVDGDGTRVGGGGNPAAFGFYANKQLTTGEGGMLAAPDPDFAARVRSERNQGRAVDMGWLDHERLGFNYRLSDVAAAIGVAQLEGIDTMLAERARVAGLYSERLDGIEGLELPVAAGPHGSRGWFVYVVRLTEAANRDSVVRALADDGIESKAYLPCIHLAPFYRERFGFQEGQFPVAESIAARSLALPFFPSMTEAQVDRVASGLHRALTSVSPPGD